MSQEVWSEQISNYRNSKRPGAFVITGEWGSGKTYTFHTIIAPLIQEHGYKLLYISLYSYGVAGKNLDDFIFEEFTSIKGIDDESKRSMGKIISSAIQDVIGRSGGGNLAGAAAAAVGGVVKKRVVDKTATHVLCFDDIDRLAPELINKLWAESIIW